MKKNVKIITIGVVSAILGGLCSFTICKTIADVNKPKTDISIIEEVDGVTVKTGNGYMLTDRETYEIKGEKTVIFRFNKGNAKND